MYFIRTLCILFMVQHFVQSSIYELFAVVFFQMPCTRIYMIGIRFKTGLAHPNHNYTQITPEVNCYVKTNKKPSMCFNHLQMMLHCFVKKLKISPTFTWLEQYLIRNISTFFKDIQCHVLHESQNLAASIT